MKNTFSKVTALALAGLVSFGSIAAAPVAAFADEAPAIEAQAVTSYYNYGDWRINQLERLATYAATINSQAAKNDVTAIRNAISSIKGLSYYGDWDYWGVNNGRYYGPEYVYNGEPVYFENKFEKNYANRRNVNLTTNRTYYYNDGYNRGGYYVDPYYGYGVGYYGDPYGNGVVYYNDPYANVNWDARYNDYIRSVDAIVYSMASGLQDPGVRSYFYNTIDREYWGYSSWNDYYSYWNRGPRYYNNNTTTVKTVASTNVYRLVNKTTNEHAFTASTAVRDTFISQGWTSEGTAWKAPESEGNAVYQLTKGNKYFYTKDTNERDTLVSRGYTNDGVAFYSYKENKNKPVYRLYNGKGKHFFTSSSSERDSLVERGWKNEGVAFYAM
jgi:hypothetical protein